MVPPAAICRAGPEIEVCAHCRYPRLVGGIRACWGWAGRGGLCSIDRLGNSAFPARRKETPRPLSLCPLISASATVPSFFQLHEALSFALKVLSSCVTRSRPVQILRLKSSMECFKRDGVEVSSPLSSYSRKVSKVLECYIPTSRSLRGD